MQEGIVFYGGTGKPHRKTPFKPEERRKKAASGLPFLWILFFGQAKKSIAATGPRTGVKLGFAIAKHQKQASFD
jgi:hypothetical protein